MRKMLQKHFTVTIINMSERLTLKTAIKRSESTECLLKLDLHKNVFSCHRIVIMMMITMTIIIIVMIIIIIIIRCLGAVVINIPASFENLPFPTVISGCCCTLDTLVVLVVTLVT